MKLLALITVLYVTPGCISQCVNCSPQPTYQYVLQVPNNYVQVPTAVQSPVSPNRSPCCVPTSNVQTIQASRAFTNGAQGSQVIMYYNGQRVVSGGSQQQPQGSGYNQNPANNYQNPGPIPTAVNQNGYQADQNQSQQAYYPYTSTSSPTNLNGGVIAGGTVAGGVVAGGTGFPQGQTGVVAGGNVPNQNQGQNMNVGGNVENQNQGQGMSTGGNVGNQNQYQNSNQQTGNTQYDNQNGYQGNTMSPSQNEVGYQPFVPSGNTGYNNNDNFNSNNDQGQYNQAQQDQQQANQNNEQVIYPAGPIVAGGAASGVSSSSSYNSPNSGYSQNQPQTYPTQIVNGGAVNSQNLQQQPGVNTQYQDQGNMGPNGNAQSNQQYGQPSGQQNIGQGVYSNIPENQQGFIGSSTGQYTQQGSTAPYGNQQGFTNAPEGQYQQSPVTSGSGQTGGSAMIGGQQGTTMAPGNQQTGGFSSTVGSFQGQSTEPGFSSTQAYQQGDLSEGLGTESTQLTGGQQQQQFTSSPGGQTSYTNGQQNFPGTTPTQYQSDPSSLGTGNPTTLSGFEPTTNAPLNPSSPQQNDQSPTPSTPFPSTQSPYPVIFPVPSAGQETTPQPSTDQSPPTTVSSNQDEFGDSAQAAFNDPDFNGQTSTQSTSSAPVSTSTPSQPQFTENSGSVPLETVTGSNQNDGEFVTSSQVTGYTPQQSTSGPILIGGGALGQSSTNSYQSTTPTTIYNNNGVTTAGQLPTQSSTGFQPTTVAPVTNENLSGFDLSSSTSNPNMQQPQYPSQQQLLDATGQTTNNGINGVSTQAPQYPSQQELGASISSTSSTQSPQFPTQQELGSTASTISNFNGAGGQQTTSVAPQFPSQQELLQRDQQNNNAGGSVVNDAGFTPQYGDMNTQYGHYASSTASSNPQFDQPTADQQQNQSSSVHFSIIMFLSIVTISLW